MLRTFFVSTFLALPLYVAADPVITKVSISGDYVEVWGSGFGTKPNVKPLVWMNYESTNDPSLSRLDLSQLGNDSTIAPDIKNPSNNVAKYNLRKGGAAGPDGVPFNSDHLYVSVSRFYNFDMTQPELLTSPGGGGLNLKPFRLWKEWTHSILLGYQGMEGVDSGRITPELTEEFSQWTGSTVRFRGFRWFTQEYLYTSSDLNTRNGLLQIYTDGIKASSTPMTTISTKHPDKYKKLYLDQVSNYSLPIPIEVYLDDIYIDDTFTRVVLTDNEKDYTTEAPSSFRLPMTSPLVQSLPLIPVEWRTDYIKAKITNPEKISTFKYLYVFDSTNKVNKTGALVCPRCPKSPSPI